MKKLIKGIEIASGKEKAPFVLKNCNIINVFSEEIITGDIAIYEDKIVGIGQYEGEVEQDVKGRYVAPGFIDSHVHIESSMVSPAEFAKAVLPCGTTTVIADPHEIANVYGLNGIKYILDNSEHIPLDVYVMLPSCVPATNFESSGAKLTAEELKKFIHHPRVLGLGEMMNYPGVIEGDLEVMEKLQMASDKIIDGHAPSIKGEALNGYAFTGIKTDHECTTVDEMLDRIRAGMYVQIREGSAAKNLSTLIKGVTDQNYNRIIFCTDDKHPKEILKDGHINYNIKLSVENGVDPIRAIKMATLNAAQCYQLSGVGAIGPGYKADLVILEDLVNFNVVNVIKQGKEVVSGGQLLEKELKSKYYIQNSINIQPIEKAQLEIQLTNNHVHVIQLVEKEITTKLVKRNVTIKTGQFIHTPGVDIVKMVVVERHNRTGNIGLGLLEGLGLNSGAIASTIAHDSHNIIAAGINDEDILLAIHEIKNIGGGIVVVDKGQVKGSIALPIGGLMTDKELSEVDELLDGLHHLAHDLGINPGIDPFMTLGFLALPVIPEVRLTDKGLFDVTQFEFISTEEVDK